MTRTRTRKLNPPEPCGGRKPASEITDRALRYRANSEECKPEGEKRCMWCGAAGAYPRDHIQVGHIDGNETNTERENLAWCCRSCNQKISAAMKKAGVGRATNQYNPKIDGPVEWKARTPKHGTWEIPGRWTSLFQAKTAFIEAYPSLVRDSLRGSRVPGVKFLPVSKQANPRKRKRGITDYREFQQALAITRGDEVGDVQRAVELIRATPMSRRSEFQKDIWAIRKERYGPSGRKDGGAVPF